MFYMRGLLQCVASISLICLSLQLAADDQHHDVCRRWGHQTCIVNNKVYIDGGLIAFGDEYIQGNEQMSPDLYYESIDRVSELDFPTQFKGMWKSPAVPCVQGGILWPDNANKIFYLYGGEYLEASPAPFDLWFFDTTANTWNQTFPDNSQTGVSRASFGAGVTIEDRGWSYYFGGWLSNLSVPGWVGPPLALNSMLKYDMIANKWTNTTYNHMPPSAEGVMLYIPASDAGMLVYFGGVQPSRNSNFTMASLQYIYLYDIKSGRWFSQPSSGDIPEGRRRLCAGVVWASDHSSYNLYMYGGYDLSRDAFVDVYILSMPSFQWILMYPNETVNASSFGKAMTSCNVIYNSQMIIMGGTSGKNHCDFQKIDGQHNLYLGQVDDSSFPWGAVETSVTSYLVPDILTSAIGGGPSGSATATDPVFGWAHPDLSACFGKFYSATARLPTTSTMNSTPSATDIRKTHLNVGAIAGGTVGGVIVLAIGITTLVCCCIRKRKRNNSLKLASAQQQQYLPPPPDQQQYFPPPPDPQQYDSLQVAQEMPGVRSPVLLDAGEAGQ